MAAKRTHMSASERREQLTAVARGLFTRRDFDATNVEEVAARAQVSKPVIYEHFGDRGGLYTVVVDREIIAISVAISSTVADSATDVTAMPKARRCATKGPDASGSASQAAERATLTLLTYIEGSPDGFRILSADSDRAAGIYSTLLANVTIEVSGILASQFTAHDLDPRTAPLCAQMLVSIVTMLAQWWLENRSIGEEKVATYMINLAWNGLRGMRIEPTLHPGPTDSSHGSEDALRQGTSSRTESAVHRHSATNVTEPPGAP